MAVRSVNPYAEVSIPMSSPISPRFVRIVKNHPGDIYGAFQEDPDLFRRHAPTYDGFGVFTEDCLTDQQAGEVLSLLGRVTVFDLFRCPNLTGVSFRHLPLSTETLNCPMSTEYSDLAALTPLTFPNLRTLYVTNIVNRTSVVNLSNLIQVERFHIPTPLNSFSLATFLPPYLKYLALYGGKILQGDRVPEALETLDLHHLKIDEATVKSLVSVRLRSLYLAKLSSITADCFANCHNLKLIYCFACPGVDKQQFLHNTAAVANRSLMTADEFKKADETYRQLKIL